MFRLIDTVRDGRIIRQTFARELGQVGCLVLVSTTIYADMARPATSNDRDSQMSLDEMISSCPIENVIESLAYVPGIKIGDTGLTVIDGYGGVSIEAPKVSDD